MKNKLVLVVDDDPDFNNLIKHVLGKFGLIVEAFTDGASFLKRLDSSAPALCIIDLNLGTVKEGFELIQSIRTRKPSGPGGLPLFIASSTVDHETIAHALEIGADDYILKPIRREVIASKLLNYVKSAELEDVSLNSITLSEGEFPVTMELELEVLEVDEFGIKVKSRHLITKGTPISLTGAFFVEVTGSERPKLVTVTTTWVEVDLSGYGAYLEFELADEKLLQAVRNWLITKLK